MKDFLNEERFDFVTKKDKRFIHAFDDEMTRLGYGFGGKVGSGYCWGKYMLIYSKTGVKSKKVFARIYFRDESIVLRFFFNDIDKHRGYIEGSPAHVKEVFVGEYGRCEHCQNEKNGQCKFRKTYTIDDQFIEKCNGKTFEFYDPHLERLGDYLSLFTEFYPSRKK